MRYSRALCLGLIALATACGGPAAGSEEDLSAQLDELELPASFVQLGELYEEECPGNCPSFVRWYDATAPPETIRAQLVSRFEAADIEISEASASSDLYAARNDEHIFFVVLDTNMIAGNANAPAGTDLEISVQLLPES